MSTTFLYGANVAANGIRQHYLRYGGPDGAHRERTAIILIPGITSPAITWGFVGEVLGRKFDTYVIDVRGRGLSEASPTLDYSVAAQGDDVVAFAVALGLKRFALVGHSMGARIAARAAMHKPAGLASVVLVDPPVSGPGRREYPGKTPWYVDSMALAREGTDAEAMRAFCPTWTEHDLQLRAEWLHTCDERAVLESYKEFHTEDFHADAARLHVPSLLITAERGDVVRDEDVAELQDATPSMLHVRVPDAGHMIPWDNAAGFYAAFGDFLGAPLV
ncbi:alpha/beta hydrolase [Paraburkholderia phytofirmans]|jgi:N-formylmaleamate deformylase|uniref:alpha/beta fold hydrolase n=1 Tax=Paraburkholderia sp. BL9I2N2 TaxID=1938809 RepID=UPI00104A27D0|nr:alpha/beta hydrolase [Paraburkholderia sp. BL9I2N2]TCK88568.1 N-formylmaleamate deformylase [Paraburkholderia sp. BL9I2N2]